MGGLKALLPAPFVVPRYEGRSIGNIPATFGALWGLEVGSLPPLAPSLWQPLLGDGVERVLFLLLDAVGWERMNRALAQDAVTACWLEEVGAVVEPITSIFPSTTTAALTTIWTGTPPAQHGMVGYTVWLREFGVVANMIALQVAHKGLRADLLDAGLDTERFVPVPTLAQQLKGADIPLFVLIGAAIRGSGLSQLHFRGSEQVIPYAGLGDCLSLLRALLDKTSGQRALIAAYWPSFDTLSHIHGPNPSHWDAEWHIVMTALRDVLLRDLSPEARRRTLVVITADHGHNTVPEEGVVLLSDHPELTRRLVVEPTGDSRAPYLHVRDGERAAVRAYVEERWGHAFTALDVDEALAAGLWGPGPLHPDVRSRLGDLVLLAHDGYALDARKRETPLIGRHGGLWPDEALVPWIAFRLD